jgi:thiosulfate reductase / polysulfide reductase chain A
MSLTDTNISRRKFLKLGGVTAASAAVSGSGLKYLQPSVFAGASFRDDATLYGTCGVCSMGCAYIAHLHGAHVTHLTGNPADQTAEGSLCVKGYSGLRLLYDPDRLKFPMKRTNPDKGVGVDPGWVIISWDEALDTVASQFKRVRDTFGPEAIVLVARTQTWQKHFAQSIGTPNHIGHNNTCYTTHDVVWRAMVTGKGKTWTVDYEHSKYILAFGWNGPGNSKNHWGRAVNHAIANGAKLVVFDPRLSITASKAHEWVPIKPGTDLAALLAMIHVIIDEDLYDHDFVDNYTVGLEEVKAQVKDYTPDWAAPICEVPAETLARIAREFAQTKPAVIAHHKRDAGGPNYANSWKTAQCYVIMDALVGSLDRPGGHILDRQPKLPGLRDVWQFPDYPDSIKGARIDGLDRFPVLKPLGKGSFSTLAEGILSQSPYAADESPVCVRTCPFDALKLGERGALIAEAEARIGQQPDRYINHVYGKEEAGGTSWLYLAAVPFKALGLPELGPQPVPALSESVATYATPIALATVGLALAGVYRISKRRIELAAHPESENEEETK